jgi:hypothetical protein
MSHRALQLRATFTICLGRHAAQTSSRWATAIVSQPRLQEMSAFCLMRAEDIPPWEPPDNEWVNNSPVKAMIEKGRLGIGEVNEGSAVKIEGEC